MECEPSHFEQTSWWANVESEDGWNARYIVAGDMGRIVAGAIVLVRRQLRVGRVGYVLRGPLTRGEPSNAEHVWKRLASALKSFARKEQLVLLVVVPPYDGIALASALLSVGFLRHPRLLPPSNLPPGTIAVDLWRNLKEIEQSYRRTIRWEINRARKKGVVVKLGTAEDLELFWARHLELCQRRGVGSNVPGFGYVCRVWYEFHQRGRAWLFNAMLAEEVLCSLICLGVGKWFYAWRIGWASASKKAYPTQAVFAQAIRTAAGAGYQFFDFMAISPDEAARLRRGEKVNSPTAGMTFFKLGFGGSVRTLSPALDWFPNPILRFLMRIYGLRLLSSTNLVKLVRRLSPHRL